MNLFCERTSASLWSTCQSLVYMTVHTVQSLNNECSCLPIIHSVCGHLRQLTGIHFQIWFLYSCDTEEMSTVYLWRSESHENPITNLSHLEMEAHSLIVQKTNEIPQHSWLFTPINSYCVRYGFCQPSAPVLRTSIP